MKVTFQIEGGSPVKIECNMGDNLLLDAETANLCRKVRALTSCQQLYMTSYMDIGAR